MAKIDRPHQVMHNARVLEFKGVSVNVIVFALTQPGGIANVSQFAQ